jgi:hypothetical protein
LTGVGIGLFYNEKPISPVDRVLLIRCWPDFTAEGGEIAGKNKESSEFSATSAVRSDRNEATTFVRETA